MNTSRRNPIHSVHTVKRMAEAGYTVAIQSIYYTVLIFTFFAFIFDFGNVGYVYTISSNSARLAAQDAAKNVDMQWFIDNQEIRLSPDALTRAQEFVSGMTDGKMTVTEVSLSPDKHFITLRAVAYAGLPVLNSLFGLQPVEIPVQAFAQPAYGISEEGQ